MSDKPSLIRKVKADRADCVRQYEEDLAWHDALLEALESTEEAVVTGKPVTQSAPSSRQVEEGSRRATAQSAAAVAAGRSLPEPFDTAAMVGTGLFTKKHASEVMMRWRTIGWVTPRSRGRYARSDSFGAGVEAPVAGAEEDREADAPQSLETDDSYEPPAPPAPDPVRATPKDQREALEMDNTLLMPTDAGAVKIGQSLTEPFTATDVQARLDGNPNRGYMWIATWMRHGWVRKVGAFAYNRSDKFGR